MTEAIIEKLTDLAFKIQNASEVAVEEVKGLTVEDVKQLGEKPEIYSEAVILLIAIVAILVGASWSVPRKGDKKGTGDEVHVSAREAAMFPIAGSVVLLSLYICYKLIPRELFNNVLSFYFLVVSMYAVSQAVFPVLKQGILSGLLAIALAASWWMTGHFVVNNCIAFGICISSLWKIKLPSFAVAWLLLWGLFIYDIWWVFGTEVMVSVAKNIEAPVLLKMPKDLFADEYKPSEMMLLGLGDIVIPGFFIAMCLRYDHYKKSTVKIYFMTAIIAYTCGLVNTILVMFLFKHAQPALLYLVPWITFSTLLVSILTLDTFRMFSYNEEAADQTDKTPEEKQKEKEEEESEENLTYPQAAYNIIVAELFHLEKIRGVKEKVE